ncbi:hypothetical protein P175DRAFT_0508365 [Aspergillus ochraceoroseus IBT 24754]|nr:uncharacterized protein P175DRAFT_0508365 [Aspergillus ochraceoroseus IBT 24754]PTU21384.1 hypothetical protein P175DRAFT_0508365 [Aspergillus ochraceoroseus IBT 24754]
MDVFVSGSNNSGELGIGNRTESLAQPILSTTLNAEDVGVVQLVTRGRHCAALTHDNKILTWGACAQGQLGRKIDRGDDPRQKSKNSSAALPGEVDRKHFPPDTVFVQLAVTDHATFVLTEDGYVYGWGAFKNSKGVEAFTGNNRHQFSPMLIPELHDVTKLVAGSQHVLALTAKGSVYAWGNTERKALGRRMQGRMNNVPFCFVPRACAVPFDVVNISAGAHHSFAIRQTGAVYSWGANEFGQTGVPLDSEGPLFDSSDQDDSGFVGLPREVYSLRGHRVSSVAGGRHHSVAVTEDGRCLSWGRVDTEILGIEYDDLPQEEVMRIGDHGEHSVLMTPTLVTNIDGKVSFATAADERAVVVTRKGQAFSWGASGHVHGDTVELPTLMAVDGKRVVSAAVGDQYSILLSEHTGAYTATN